MTPVVVPNDKTGEFDVCCVMPDAEEASADERVAWLAADSKHDLELLHLLNQIEGWMGAILQYGIDHTSQMQRFWSTDGIFRRAARGKRARHQQVLDELKTVIEIVQRDLARCNVRTPSTAASQAFETDEVADQRRADAAFEGCGDKAGLIERIKSELYPRFYAVIRLMHEAVAGFDIEAYRDIYRRHAEQSDSWLATLGSKVVTLGASMMQWMHGFIVFVRANKQQIAVQIVALGVVWALPSALFYLKDLAVIQLGGEVAAGVFTMAPMLFRTGQVAIAAYYTYRKWASVIENVNLLRHVLFTATTIYASENRGAALAKLPAREVQQRLNALFTTVDNTPGMSAVFTPQLAARFDDAGRHASGDPSPKMAKAMLESPAGISVTQGGPGGLEELTGAIGTPPTDRALAATLEAPIPAWLQDPAAPDRSTERRAQLKLKGVLDALTLVRSEMTTEAMLELLKATSQEIAADFAGADSRLQLLTQELPMLLLHHTVLDGQDWKADRATVAEYANWTCTAYARLIGLPATAKLQSCTLMDPEAFEQSGTFRSLQNLKTDMYDPVVVSLTESYKYGRSTIEGLYQSVMGPDLAPRRPGVTRHMGKGPGGGPKTHDMGLYATKKGRILRRLRKSKVNVTIDDQPPEFPLLLEGPPPPELPEVSSAWLDLTIQAIDALPYILAVALAQPEKAMVVDLATIPRRYREMPTTITPFDELSALQLRQMARQNGVAVEDWYDNPLPAESIYAELVDGLASDAIRRDRITLKPNADALYRRCRTVHRRYDPECQAYAYEHADEHPDPTTVPPQPAAEPTKPQPRRRSMVTSELARLQRRAKAKGITLPVTAETRPLIEDLLAAEKE
jgi:hypothetical protein